RVCDGALGAWPVELLPRRRDELDVPPALLGARRQTAVGRRAPHVRSCRTQDLVPSLNRERQLVERPAQPFEEQRAPRLVVSQQSHATLAVRETQDGDLVSGGLIGAGNKQLQNCGRAVVERGLGYERLGHAGIGTTDNN